VAQEVTDVTVDLLCRGSVIQITTAISAFRPKLTGMELGGGADEGEAPCMCCLRYNNLVLLLCHNSYGTGDPQLVRCYQQAQ